MTFHRYCGRRPIPPHSCNHIFPISHLLASFTYLYLKTHYLIRYTRIAPFPLNPQRNVKHLHIRLHETENTHTLPDYINHGHTDKAMPISLKKEPGNIGS